MAKNYFVATRIKNRVCQRSNTVYDTYNEAHRELMKIAKMLGININQLGRHDLTPTERRFFKTYYIAINYYRD